MNYYTKYLKYKNKYSDLKNILGGSLKGEEKKLYIRLLNQLFIKPYDENKDKCYSSILKYLLLIAYKESLKIFNEYIKLITEDNKKLKISEDYNIIYNDAIKNIEDSKNLDIPEFNIRSLQIVILYTELIKYIETDETKTNMQNYFQQPQYKINEEYYNFIKVWTDYEKLFEAVSISEGFQSIIYKRIEKKLLSYKDIKRSRIICYLDYLTEKEIILSYVYEIYYLGINEKLDYADGRELTPFEFLHHDITHSNNRGIYGFNSELEKQFYYYLEEQKEKLLSTEKKQIYIIFFILVHESFSEYLIETKSILDENINFNSLLPNFVINIDNWFNSNFYNGLLPKTPQSLRTNPTEIKTY